MTISEDRIERAARAICKDCGNDPDEYSFRDDALNWRIYKSSAKAALTSDAANMRADIDSARAEEREACAVLAWSIGMNSHMRKFDARELGSDIAAAIRARTPVAAEKEGSIS